MGERLGVSIGVTEEVIIKACSMSIEAYTSSKKKHVKQYVYRKVKGLPEVVVFAFDGLRTAEDWKPFENTKINRITAEDWKPFENTKINRIVFPSIRSIGTDDGAMVNKAFVLRFEAILNKEFVDKVEKATKENQIVFAGHSSGGGVAILITLWFFEKYIRTGICQKPPQCITFGSPLIGDRIISHALRRENWAQYFVHFVTRYDIVPRIMLSPLSSIEEMLKFILPFKKEFIHEESNQVSELFKTVMKNALYVASHSACKIMGGGGTDPLLENVLAFVPLSPYRPFGTYIFSTGNGRLAVVKNPDAVLQMLFYCAQPTSEENCAQVARSSLNEHMRYESELENSISGMQDVVYLDHPEEVPLSSNGSASHDPAGTNSILTDFGLSAHARICLRAAGEFEKRKVENEDKIDSEKKNIQEGLDKIEKYKSQCNVTYYDSYKRQEHVEDFDINILRLNLAGIWDELIEMLKKSELPDRFEGRKEWIKLGTNYRRLAEPLDIGNYYRHQKYKESGPYMGEGKRPPRPKRYKFTQRWREHDEKMAVDSSSESCFLAHVEQLIVRASKESFEAMKEDILKVEREMFEWVRREELGEDVFSKGSTFAEWWKKLPDDHRSKSCLAPKFT